MTNPKTTKRELIEMINKELPLGKKIILEETTIGPKKKYLITEKQLACVVNDLIKKQLIL